MDFSKIPVFDNHAHSINASVGQLTTDEFLGLYRGYGDDDSVPNNDIRDPVYGAASPEVLYHASTTAAVHSTICHMAKFFKCEPTLEAVVATRNKMIEGGMQGYAEALYKGVGLNGGVLETTIPIGEDVEDKMEGHTVCRLFQFDDPFFTLIKQVDNFDQLQAAWEKEAAEALTSGYYDGIKCHIAEVYSHKDLRYVTREEADFYFKRAQQDDKKALNIVYMALLCKAMVFSQKYDAPIHLHVSNGGSTTFGEPKIKGALTCKDGSEYDADPLLLVPFLAISEFRKTKIVCLHGGYPWTREVAILAGAFPNVYVDVSLSLSSCGLGGDSYMIDLLSRAPHSKIMIGSGQVGHPEKALMAAMLGREILERVFTDAIARGYMTEAMAEESAKNILYRNATRVHKLYKPE